MKTLKQRCGLIFMSILIVLASCGDDDQKAMPDEPEAAEPKSSEKAITAFTFSALSPQIVATVSQSTKSITTTLPNGTDLATLVPTVIVSERASVTTASGAVPDFTSPVTYIVTAEDGTTQQYRVTLSENPMTSFTVTGFDLPTSEQGGVLGVRGADFVAIDETRIVLTHTSTQETYEFAASLSSSDSLLLFAVPEIIELGDYTGMLYVGEESVSVPGQTTIVVATPVIASVTPTSLFAGEILTLRGEKFAPWNNVVKITRNTTSWVLQKQSESITEITVRIPSTVAEGEYTLSVKTAPSSVETFYTTANIVVAHRPGKPTMVTLDKTSYKIGQTISMTGTSFRKAGVATYLYFVPFTSGLNFTGTGVTNAEGTALTFTIPANFTPGVYEVIVSVDGINSDTYPEMIQVSN